MGQTSSALVNTMNMTRINSRLNKAKYNNSSLDSAKYTSEIQASQLSIKTAIDNAKLSYSELKGETQMKVKEYAEKIALQNQETINELSKLQQEQLNIKVQTASNIAAIESDSLLDKATKLAKIDLINADTNRQIQENNNAQKINSINTESAIELEKSNMKVGLTELEYIMAVNVAKQISYIMILEQKTLKTISEMELDTELALLLNTARAEMSRNNIRNMNYELDAKTAFQIAEVESQRKAELRKKFLLEEQQALLLAIKESKNLLTMSPTPLTPPIQLTPPTPPTPIINPDNSANNLVLFFGGVVLLLVIIISIKSNKEDKYDNY